MCSYTLPGVNNLDKNNLRMALPEKGADPHAQKWALLYWMEMSGQLAFSE